MATTLLTTWHPRLLNPNKSPGHSTEECSLIFLKLHCVMEINNTCSKEFLCYPGFHLAATLKMDAICTSFEV